MGPGRRTVGHPILYVDGEAGKGEVLEVGNILEKVAWWWGSHVALG